MFFSRHKIKTLKKRNRKPSEKVRNCLKSPPSLKATADAVVPTGQISNKLILFFKMLYKNLNDHEPKLPKNYWVISNYP